MQNFRLSNICYFTICLILSVIVIGFPPGNVFAYDVFGYYMYLPFQFKYHDLTLHNYDTVTQILKNYKASETFYQAVKWDNGNWVMRYPVGLSIFYAPFYFIADLIAPHTKYAADGFSKPYQLSVLYGCLIYTLIGLHFIKKTLLQFFSDKTTALCLIGIALGTNYFLHTSLHGQGAMSHNLLFTLYAAIIYFSTKWHKEYSSGLSVVLGICVGLAALCRPSEIISGLIPLLYGVIGLQSFKERLALLLKLKKQVFLFGIALFCMGFIQLCYYKFASGRFFINPYGSGNPGEGLELFRPHLLEVLFSFRKGWFIYTPLMIFIVFGFVQLYKKNRGLFLFVLIYTLANVYIVASWSCWWFGSCFGNRALIANYAALAIPLGYFLEYVLNSKLKFIYLTAFILFISLNLFQSWQLHQGILDTTNMSRDYYFSTFLQTSPPTPQQTKLLLRGKSNTEIETFTKNDSLTHSMNFFRISNHEDGKAATKDLCDSLSHSGKYSLPLTPQTVQGSCIVEGISNITKKSYTWIKASVWVYSAYPADSLDAYFKINMIHNTWEFKPVKYKLTNSNFKPNQWNKLEYYYLTPDDLRSKKDEVRICFMNEGNLTIFVDDLLIESYEPIIDKSVF